MSRAIFDTGLPAKLDLWHYVYVMSQNQFFNVGKNVFNKDHVIAITQETEKIEVVRNVAVVFIAGRNQPIRISLPEGKTVDEFLSADKLNQNP